MRFSKMLLAAAAAGVFATPAFAQAAPAAKPAKVEVKQEQKAQTKAEKKADKAQAKAQKKEAHAEHKAFDTANAAPKKWLAAVPKITKAERAQINTIEKKYKEQIATLKKNHLAAEKAGTEDDSQIAAKVQAIVDQEKAEIRGVLTADQQTKFDANVAKSTK